MKVVILAGGKGTRISEESKIRPKPMVTIGGRPILWHIMKHYSYYGFYDFVICCGYKGHMIKEYFVNYYMNQNNISFHLKNESVEILNNEAEPWKVTLVDTGLETLTAGRLLQVRKYLDEKPFMLTYGDGVSDIDIQNLIAYHRQGKKVVTISATKPEGRFGALHLNEKTHEIRGFQEKARMDQSWVNMGFMVMEPQIFSYLGDGSEMLERGPFEQLAENRQMDAFFHEGFWSPMDNLHDREYLEQVYRENGFGKLGTKGKF